VRGTALTIAEAREAEETSGITEKDWWETTTAALNERVPDFADRFPASTMPDRSVHPDPTMPDLVNDSNHAAAL